MRILGVMRDANIRDTPFGLPCTQRGQMNAPILQVDDDYYEDMDYDSTVKLLEALRRGARPAPGSVIGRQTSAPVGGPQTLTDVAGE